MEIQMMSSEGSRVEEKNESPKQIYTDFVAALDVMFIGAAMNVDGYSKEEIIEKGNVASEKIFGENAERVDIYPDSVLSIKDRVGLKNVGSLLREYKEGLEMLTGFVPQESEEAKKNLMERYQNAREQLFISKTGRPVFRLG